jgi:hypothetical protein
VGLLTTASTIVPMIVRDATGYEMEKLLASISSISGMKFLYEEVRICVLLGGNQTIPIAIRNAHRYHLKPADDPHYE